AGDVVAADALSQAMRREVIDSLVYHAHRGDGVRAWLESPYSFARSEVLASIYGVPVWDGESEPPTFPEGERAGLLTRAAFLANRTHKTRPIMRGVLIREMLLCDELPEPPPDAANAMLDIPDGTLMTTRETVERLTEVGG